MTAFNKRPLLVVDDSKDDVELLKRAFHKSGWSNPIVTFGSGEEAIDYLVRCLEAGEAERESLPVAVLTDLKMTRGDGFQLLQWIRSQAVLDHILRVVITNSSIETDVQRAFDVGANFFLTKPAGFNDFVMFAVNFLAWLKLNRYPAGMPSKLAPHLSSPSSAHSRSTRGDHQDTAFEIHYTTSESFRSHL